MCHSLQVQGFIKPFYWFYWFNWFPQDPFSALFYCAFLFNYLKGSKSRSSNIVLFKRSAHLLLSYALCPLRFAIIPDT